MERCPNCRARCDGGPQCRRCGMQLDLLAQVEHAADACLAEAVESLGAGDIAAARCALEKSRRLKRSPLSGQLLGFIHEEGRRKGAISEPD